MFTIKSRWHWLCEEVSRKKERQKRRKIETEKQQKMMEAEELEYLKYLDSKKNSIGGFDSTQKPVSHELFLGLVRNLIITQLEQGGTISSQASKNFKKKDGRIISVEKECGFQLKPFPVMSLFKLQDLTKSYKDSPNLLLEMLKIIIQNDLLDPKSSQQISAFLTRSSPQLSKFFRNNNKIESLSPNEINGLLESILSSPLYEILLDSDILRYSG